VSIVKKFRRFKIDRLVKSWQLYNQLNVTNFLTDIWVDTSKPLNYKINTGKEEFFDQVSKIIFK